MKITSFEDDLLGYESFAADLERFIPVERQFVEGSLVLALSAEFGAGKTTFLTMWQEKLTSLPEKEKPLVIYLNAWESDYYGDPLFAIVSALVDRIDVKKAKKIITASKQIGATIGSAVKQVIEHKTGVNVDEAKMAAETASLSPLQLQLGEDAFSLYRARQKGMGSLKRAIKEFVAKMAEPYLLFMVDELDRCRPDYAISYLETIKHIFDIEKAVFILAADRQQLENSAKKAFGADLNFDEYYRKFVHREAALPPIDEQKYSEITQKYIEVFLEKTQARETSIDLHSSHVERFQELVKLLNLTPRQVQEVFRITGHVCAKPHNKDGQNKLLQMLSAGTLIMAALRVGNFGLYKQVGSRRMSLKDAESFADQRIMRKKSEWWLYFLITGGAVHIGDNEDAFSLLKKTAPFKARTDDDIRRGVSSFYQSWSGYINRVEGLVETFHKIEHVMQWSK